VLEVVTEHPPSSAVLSVQSAIKDAIVNADALSDIAGGGLDAFAADGVVVTMETSPSTDTTACIFARCYYYTTAFAV